MGMCDSCLAYLLIGFIVSPAVLQGIGLFGSDWIGADSCSTLDYKPSCCNSSSVYSSCSGPFELSDLNAGVYSMQWVAFFILLTPIACGLLDIYCSNDDEEYEIGACAILGSFCFLFYPLAGVLSFIGCMIIVGEYSGQSFGSSFNVCLAAGLYVLIVTGILIFMLYLKRKRKAQAGNQGVVIQRDESLGAAAPYDGGPQVVQHVQVEERVHARTESGFYSFVRTINVYHALTH